MLTCVWTYSFDTRERENGLTHRLMEKRSRKKLKKQDQCCKKAFLTLLMREPNFIWHKGFGWKIRGQSYKTSTLVNYDYRVVSISNLPVITTLES